mgnify:CR=1 FL=1
MNRKNFFKTILGLGAFFGCIKSAIAKPANKKIVNKKYGFVHAGFLPKGEPMDWKVIDNKTGKHIKFLNRDKINNEKLVSHYYIEYADDIQGIVGGQVMLYKSYDYNTLIRTEHFFQKRDISIVYKGTNV